MAEKAETLESQASAHFTLPLFQKITDFRDFPGGPVVETLHFHCRGCGFDP